MAKKNSAPDEPLTAKVFGVKTKPEYNGWGRSEGQDELGHKITITGQIAEAPANTWLTFYGHWINHKKYGRQFAVSQWTAPIEVNDDEIYSFLKSGLVKGITPAIGTEIYKRWGKDSLKVLDENLSAIRDIKGVGEKRLGTILSSLEETRARRNLMIFLSQYGLTSNLCTKIYDKYGEKSVDVLKENPYKLADDIYGVGFKKADEVALALGIEKDSPFRVKSAICFVIDNEAQTEGHCFTEAGGIVSKVSQLIDVDEGLVFDSLCSMRDENALMCEEERCFPSLLEWAEDYTATRLLSLATTSVRNLPAASLVKAISDDMRQKITYGSEQLKAIEMALAHKCMILTGGPGTGKTTTVNGIIRGFVKSGLSVVLAAPTGRAAKRMKETTGFDAYTIHRLIGRDEPGSKTEAKPINGDVLILDECSMIDIVLMARLLEHVPKTFRIVFCGDVDQLPSVGPGSVFRDMIDSGVIPTARLKTVFRQSSRSEIVDAAHAINEGRDVRTYGKEFDFRPVKVNPDELTERSESARKAEMNQLERQKIADVILRIVTVELPSRGFKPEDIQVLCPMRKYEIGCDKLNLRLQKDLNGDGKQLPFGVGETCFRVGDRVMQCENDYHRDVFNGDVGTVIGSDQNTLCVNFDGRVVPCNREQTGALQLSYATTVHKSQGSEYPVVVMPLSVSNSRMLTRKLLYTAVTRAKKLMILVGTQKAKAIAIKRNETAFRRTYLKQRLLKIFPKAPAAF